MTKCTPYTTIFSFFFSSFFCILAQKMPVSFKVGAILDMDTWVGKMSNACISTAIHDFYASNPHYGTRLSLHTRDSKDFSTTFKAACELLNDVEVQVIVGPKKSGQAEIVAELGSNSHVPVVSFSATNPSISRNHIPYLISMIQNYTYQFEAIASIIRQFKWKEVVLIYEENDYRNEIISSLISKLQAINVHVRYRSIISPSASEHEIVEELHKLLGIPIRVFIVHMSSSLGRIFFPKVKEVGLMSEGNAWITTEGFTNHLGSMDPSVVVAMRGVIGVKSYVPSSDDLDKLRFRIRRKIFKETATDGTLSICCLQAYDTICALAMAAERLFTKHNTRKPNKTESFGDTEDFRVSDMGPELLREILDSEFKGLSGKIHLLDGQSKPVAFQVINIIGRGERDIGFWIPTLGLSQHLNMTSQPYLRPVIWPGGSTTVPKGWVFLAKGKKLKIGYYLRDAFSEFVNVSSDGTVVTGYCIDVFKAVVKALPYVLNYEFVPFRDFEKDGIYTDIKDYDVVVGDITVTANRSLVVDFSLPYTRGGVTMLVPIKYTKIKNLQIVFSAFSWKKCSLQCGLFILIFVNWYLKHVKGSCFVEGIYTARTISLVSVLSVIREFEGVNKVAKLIVQIFVIAYLVILIQVFVQVVFYYNYQLTTVDVQDLVRGGDFVGYQKEVSFVKVVLKQLGFNESQLKAYNSPEQYDEALEKGSGNGGVSAIFDEVPYINLVLEKYCYKYRRDGPLYQMNGFGFVFPRGSPLVSDFSRAISSIVEGEKIQLIEKRWLGSERTCKNPTTNKSSNILSYSKSMLLFAMLLMLLSLTHVLFLIAQKYPTSESRLLRPLRLIFAVQSIPTLVTTISEETYDSESNGEEDHNRSLAESGVSNGEEDHDVSNGEEDHDRSSTDPTKPGTEDIHDISTLEEPSSSNDIKHETKNGKRYKFMDKWKRKRNGKIVDMDKEAKH